MSDASVLSHGGMPSLTRYAWLSVLAAVLTIGLKSWAYLVTGSVGLLSDAAESLVNLVAALIALGALWFSARPADAGHPFGHGKAEYFASGFEGALILLAAAGIAWAAFERWMHPQPLAQLNVGMAFSAGAALINLAVALVLLRAGRRHGSITLEADGRHLLTDVWTTAAILLALAGIAVTGWLLLDPLIAFLAALQIVWSGFGLIARSVAGLLDAALPSEEKAAIERIFEHYRGEGIEFHDLRARAAGTQRLVTVHILMPGRYSVQEGHDLSERIEGDIRQAIRNATIVTHLEPLEDAASFAHERIEPQSSGDVGQPRGSGKHRGGGKPPGRASGLLGVLLLVGGGAASMTLQDVYADLAMGFSLLGLVLVLSGGRKARRPRLK
jgi:Ca2+-transporting ATPase